MHVTKEQMIESMSEEFEMILQGMTPQQVSKLYFDKELTTRLTEEL